MNLKKDEKGQCISFKDRSSLTREPRLIISEDKDDFYKGEPDRVVIDEERVSLEEERARPSLAGRKVSKRRDTRHEQNEYTSTYRA